jgi:2-dehydropantoate 2-reductase
MKRDERVLVWGAGAMGGTVGACLASAGHPVLLVDTVLEHVVAMRDDGLRLTGPVADLTVKVNAATPDEVTGEFDVVLLAVKAHHTAQAMRMLLPHVAADGAVVSIQNGLNESVIADIAGVERTVGCFVNFGADYIEPGVIHYGGRGTVVVGEVDGRDTPRIHRIHTLLRAFDDDAILSRNVQGYLWSKLAYASMLFATALGNDGIADALALPAHRRLFADLAREVVRVARAKDVRLEPFDGFDPSAFSTDASPEAMEASLDGLVAHNRTSAKTHSGIWRDLAVRRRRTEVDAQIGPVVAYGKQLAVPTPLNARLVAMIHEIEDGARPLDRANLDLLAAL